VKKWQVTLEVGKDKMAELVMEFTDYITSAELVKEEEQEKKSPIRKNKTMSSQNDVFELRHPSKIGQTTGNARSVFNILMETDGMKWKQSEIMKNLEENMPNIPANTRSSALSTLKRLGVLVKVTHDKS